MANIKICVTQAYMLVQNKINYSSLNNKVKFQQWIHPEMMYIHLCHGEIYFCNMKYGHKINSEYGWMNS